MQQNRRLEVQFQEPPSGHSFLRMQRPRLRLHM
nr:MAG TPA: hypothetical protein [Bacteriophage sp.]